MKVANGRVTNGIYSKFFALTGENYNNKELGKNGVFCNRYNNVAILHKGIFDITEPNKDYWMHINTKDEKITMNYKTLNLKRLLSYSNVAGIIVTAAVGGYYDYGTNTILIRGGKHNFSD